MGSWKTKIPPMIGIRLLTSVEEPAVSRTRPRLEGPLQRHECQGRADSQDGDEEETHTRHRTLSRQVPDAEEEAGGAPEERPGMRLAGEKHQQTGEGRPRSDHDDQRRHVRRSGRRDGGRQGQSEQDEPAHGDVGADPLLPCQRRAEPVSQDGEDTHASGRHRLHDGQRGQREGRDVEPPTDPPCSVAQHPLAVRHEVPDGTEGVPEGKGHHRVGRPVLHEEPDVESQSRQESQHEAGGQFHRAGLIGAG